MRIGVTFSPAIQSLVDTNQTSIQVLMLIALAGLLGAFYGVRYMQQHPKTFKPARIKLLIVLAGLFTGVFVVGGLCVLSCYMSDTMESITIILMVVLFVFDIVPVFKKAWKYVPEDINKSGN